MSDKLPTTENPSSQPTLIRRLIAPLILILLGLFMAVFILEVGLRLIYFQLPFGWQQQLSGARQWGVAGEPLGKFIDEQNFETDFYTTCLGDERLFARLLPHLNDVPILSGTTTWNLSTTDLGFEEIGFRSSEAESWDGVVVGDSFTLCMTVEADECWVSHLSDNLSMSWANLGMVGTGSYSHLHYLEDYGWQLDPDIVIWQFYINDFSNDYEHIITQAQGCPRATAEAEANREPPSESASRQIKTWFSRTFATYNIVVPLLKGQLNRNIQQAIPFFEQFQTTHGQTFVVHFDDYDKEEVTNSGSNLTREALLTAKEQATEKGISFLFVIAPANFQVYQHLFPEDIPAPIWQATAAWDKHLDELVLFAQTNAIDYVDLRPFLQEQAATGVPLYQAFDTHWTPEGNRLVAEYLSEIIAHNYPDIQ